MRNRFQFQLFHSLILQYIPTQATTTKQNIFQQPNTQQQQNQMQYNDQVQHDNNYNQQHNSPTSDYNNY